MTTRVSISVCMVLLLGCDPLAKGSEAQGEALSKEWETCGASMDCRASLRCSNHVCQDPKSSRMGGYYWAAGRLAAKSGNQQEATVSFQQAVGQFEAEKLAVPPGLYCDYGASLRKKTSDPKAAEQAARVLHRCALLAVPGSVDYRRALDELAQLEEFGLDPALLARGTAAATYLTRPARSRSINIDTLSVNVEKSTSARAKDYGKFAETLASDDVKAELSSCYADYFAATEKADLSVELPVRFKASYDDFEDEYYGGTLALETSGSGDVGKASACIVEKLKPMASKIGKNQPTSNWKGAYTLKLSAKM